MKAEQMRASLTCEILGRSALGQPILGWKFGLNTARPILVFGAVHGDEVESSDLIQDYLSSLLKVKDDRNSFFDNIIFIPVLNPDGAMLNQRCNFRNVDLNRNLPTSNWKAEASDPRYPPGESAASEPETKVFLGVVEKFQPKLIVSVHSFTESLVLFPGTDNSSKFAPVKKFAEKLQIPVVDRMNYSVYGSLSVYGRENNISTVTIELQRGTPRTQLLKRYSEPFASFLNEVALTFQ